MKKTNLKLAIDNGSDYFPDMVMTIKDLGREMVNSKHLVEIANGAFQCPNCGEDAVWQEKHSSGYCENCEISVAITFDPDNPVDLASCDGKIMVTVMG